MPRLMLDPTGNYLALYTEKEDKEKAKSIGDYIWNFRDFYWSYALSIDKYNRIVATFGETLEIDSSIDSWLKKEKLHREEVKIYRNAKTMPVPSGFVPKLKLFEHQEVGVNFINRFKKCLLLDEMGLGKSAQAINSFLLARQNGEVERCLVICPKTLIYNWTQEIEKHSDLSCQIIIGDRKKRDSLLKNIQAPVLITSYDVLRMHSEEDAFSDYAKDQFVIIDEATYIKNKRAKRSQAVFDIPSKYRVLLTGTPIMNKPEDCYSLIQAVKPMWRHFWDFQDKYCVKNLFGGIYTYKNLSDLKEKLESVSIRRLKEDVIDLPPKVFEDRILAMTKEQDKKYQICLNELRLEFSNCKDEEYNKKQIPMLTQLIRLNQISAGFISDGNKIEFIGDSGKFAELDDFLSATGAEEKIVIWSYFVPLIKYLGDKYKNSVILYGGIDTKERQDAIEKFKTDKNCRLFIGQVVAGGMGINLTESRTQIFWDLPPSPGQYNQAIDRLHRIGTKGTVSVIHFLSENTIDLRLRKSLTKKMNLIKQVLPDETVKMSKQDLGEIIK